MYPLFKGDLMVREILFMTGNSHKLEEAKHMFSPLGFTLKHLGFEEETSQIIEPQVDTVVEVSHSKLNQCLKIIENIHGNQNNSIMVEDSGLFIDSFEGFPGVYSAYVLKTLGCNGILNLMSNEGNRLAEYRSSVTLWDSESKEIIHGYGICPGYITTEKRGTSGFGYDPIFIPLDIDTLGDPLEYGVEGDVSTDGKTFGEVSLDCKQQFSHRRRALSHLLEQL
jgi:XTP/dITP diphosphohydrolase